MSLLLFAERKKNKVQPSNFLPHTSNCSICAPKRGRPSKDKSPHPTVQPHKTVDCVDSDMVVDEDETVDNFHNVVIHSLSSDRFSNLEVAQVFVCTICRAVPCEPVITSCSHIFCKECINGWLSRSAACPVCRDIVEDSEVSVLQGQLLQIYESLTLSCIHCDGFFKIKDLESHEMTCKFVVELS